MQDFNHNHQLSSTPFPAVNGGSGPSLNRLRTPLQLPPLNVPSGHVVFRLLCHASRIGGIIGKSGSIIKQLQQETCAKIRIEDSFPNSDDHRVIYIIASALIVKRVTLEASKRDQEEDSELNNHDEGVEVSAAQEALVRVFERVLEVAAESDGVVLSPGGLVSCRLLAESSQAGSVIGKGGKVVEKIRKDTGCKIKVLTSEKLQSCGYEMVEIEGDILGVKRALVAVTSCLQDCVASIERAKMIGSRQFEANPQPTLPNGHADFPPQRISVPQPMVASSSSYASGVHPFSVQGDRIPVRSPNVEVVFKVLCLNDRVGGVIGKGGSTVRTLQAETGASIAVGPTIAGCDERLITVTANENLDLQHSAAQNAVLRIFDKFVNSGSEKGIDLGSKACHISARLVVPSKQAGCLLGKGGAIISEMRKITGTSIRIIGGDQLPICASTNDEVVQITGEYENVRNALYNATGRLRDNIRTIKPPSVFVTESNPYGRLRDPSRPGTHPSTSAPQNTNQQNTLMQSMENLGLTQSLDPPPSPRLWTPQIVQGENNRSVTDGKGLTSVKGGVELGSGSRSAIVKNTTLEIVVPENVVGSVYGENGCNLYRLRQISGAKVAVHDPLPGTTDRIVVISGSPDETQAAQSLLQAFIINSGK